MVSRPERVLHQLFLVHMLVGRNRYWSHDWRGDRADFLLSDRLQVVTHLRLLLQSQRPQHISSLLKSRLLLVHLLSVQQL